MTISTFKFENKAFRSSNSKSELSLAMSRNYCLREEQ